MAEIKKVYKNWVAYDVFNTDYVDSTLSTSSTNAIENWAVATALNWKQDTLVSWTNIKTINWSSVLGSGDLAISWLPSQSWQAWKYLTTDWTNASWGTVSWWITNDTTGTTTTVTKIWAGTEAEYWALSSYDATTIYHIY